jgi:hypothetical protein
MYQYCYSTSTTPKSQWSPLSKESKVQTPNSNKVDSSETLELGPPTGSPTGTSTGTGSSIPELLVQDQVLVLGGDEVNSRTGSPVTVQSLLLQSLSQSQCWCWSRIVPVLVLVRYYGSPVVLLQYEY